MFFSALGENLQRPLRDLALQVQSFFGWRGLARKPDGEFPARFPERGLFLLLTETRGRGNSRKLYSSNRHAMLKIGVKSRV
jgi:hypothetical protein